MLGLRRQPAVRVMHFTAKPPEQMELNELGLVIPDAAVVNALDAAPDAAEAMPALSWLQKATSKIGGEKALIGAHRKNLIKGTERSIGEIATLLEEGLSASTNRNVACSEEMIPEGQEEGDISLALGLEQAPAARTVTVQLRSTPDGGRQTLDKYRFTQYDKKHPTTLAVDRFGWGNNIRGMRRTPLEELPLVSEALAYGIAEAGLQAAMSAQESGDFAVKGGMLWF